jgi:hypothetical protein
MRRAKISVQKADVTAVLRYDQYPMKAFFTLLTCMLNRAYSIEVSYESLLTAVSICREASLTLPSFQQVPLESADQLKEEDVVTRLQKAGGANYGPGV